MTTSSGTTRIIALVLNMIVSLFLAYISYLKWRTLCFIITQRQIIVRRGIFNHRISLAPIQNIQMVTINSGLIDR